MEQIWEINWGEKRLDEIPITELSDLRFIINNLPTDVKVEIKNDKGETVHIDEYVDARIEEFFNVPDEDFEKLVGKCFMNKEKTVVVKVVGLRDDKDNPYYERSHYIEEFLFEKYEQYGDNKWHVPDYIWLQETARGRFAKEEYIRWCFTPQTDINCSSEEMFHLGRDGNLYVDTTCGDDFMVFKPMSEATFELIRREAIETDGEYRVREYGL